MAKRMDKMMTPEQRQRLERSAEELEKAEAAYRSEVLAVMAEGGSVSELAQATGLSMNMLQRWKRESTESGKAVNDVIGRFWSRVQKTPGCWVWTAGRTGTGYGVMSLGAGRQVRAHRFSYELATGSPVPDGFFVDHICFNRACVNPEHLRLATRKQNQEHLQGARRGNRSGHRGVVWSANARRWRVLVGHQGKLHHGGYFDDPDEAAAAARALRSSLFTHNAVDRTTATHGNLVVSQP